MSITTDRVRLLYRQVRGRWPELPEPEIIERDAGARLEYVVTPEGRHILYVLRGLFDTDAALARDALQIWHEGVHGLNRTRRSSRLSSDETDRYLEVRYGAKAPELRARDQGVWGNKVEEHYACDGMSVALGLPPNIGPDLGCQLYDVGVPFDRARMEAFFAPKPVEQRIAEFWDVVDQLPPEALLTAQDVGGWALNIVERDATVRILVRDFRTEAQHLQSAFDLAGRA